MSITTGKMTMSNDYKRVDKAAELFSQGYNCCQAVFCAYSDVFGFDFDTSLRLSSGFGGGFGRMREVCGAFSAVTMIAGLARENAQPGDKAVVYHDVRILADEFKKRNGSFICRELLGVDGAPKSHVPDERNEKYINKRPCPEIVEEAAMIIEELILKNRLEKK